MKSENKTIQEMIYYPVNQHKMIRGEGVFLFDLEGKSYIDCASATFNLSLGYSHPAVLKALRDQAEQLIHVTSSFQTDPVNDLVRKLIDLSPDNITRVHPKVCGGSTANEGAIKMAQYTTGKSEVISLFRSHLGQTMMMSSMSGFSFRRANFSNRFPGSLQVPDPYCLRCFYKQKRESCALLCVDRIEDFIKYASSAQVAALIIEPISGNGGNIVPPEGYLQKLRQFCNQREIILIFDEIQTGIGRTGKMFAAQHFEVEPDIITVAKGLGGSGAQIAAILTNERLAGLPAHDHSFTYGSNLLAAAAANVTLDIIRQPEFLSNVQNTGKYIIERLLYLQKRYPVIQDVRGVGLMIGFELAELDGSPAVKLTNYLANKAMDYGLIMRTSSYGHGNVLKIRPPLIISIQEAVELCDRLETLFSTELA